MLGKSKSITTIAVHDIENSVDFYSNVLGLKKIGKNTAGFVLQGKGVTIGLYQSTVAGTGLGTCIWWTVDDVEAMVEHLKARGVLFDKNYDIPRAKRKGDVYTISDNQKAAWFKDIDGNILGLGNY